MVGDAAKSQAATNARNTVYDAKRLIGRKIDEPCVQEDMKLWYGPSPRSIIAFEIFCLTLSLQAFQSCSWNWRETDGSGWRCLGDFACIHMLKYLIPFSGRIQR
jgi:hypothetical protein